MSVTMPADPFVRHRNLLYTVAYQLTGSAADAEDAVQDAWIRWSGVDQDQVRDPRAYLVRVVSRTALDRLRALARRREDYYGPWLPEPLLTSPDVAQDVELADSLSMAMLVVLESLSPTERAVFVLREVFDVPYDELSEAVGKEPAAVRQIAHRARSHVAARRPRAAASRTEARAALEAFRRAVVTGDLQDFVDLLAPEVVSLADGGRPGRALPNPIVGADHVARVLAAGLARHRSQLSAELVEVNGWPAVALRLAGELYSVTALRMEDGLVREIYTVANPDKLTRLGGVAPLTR